MVTTTILDCGHAPSEHGPHTTGYGTDKQGKKHCYACCAAGDIETMNATGKITLYLTRHEGAANVFRYEVTNWPGSLRFPAVNVRVSRNGGGFGSQRKDADFNGPDGYVWHAVNRGDMNLARCTRTKKRAAWNGSAA